jgi:Putative Actinobacterial Holin-X, holin superfamily III
MDENINMENTPTSIELLFERIESLSKTTVELSKLKALETTSDVVTALISRLLLILVLLIFLTILSMGVAFMLGDYLSKPYCGFFIVAAFYFVVAIVLYFNLSKWIKKPIIDLIIPELP